MQVRKFRVAPCEGKKLCNAVHLWVRGAQDGRRVGWRSCSRGGSFRPRAPRACDGGEEMLAQSVGGQLANASARQAKEVKKALVLSGAGRACAHAQHVPGEEGERVQGAISRARVGN